MKIKYILITITLLILGSALSACVGGAGPASSWPGLITNGDTAYVAFNQHIYAIQVANGLEKWRFPTEADNNISFYADPVLSPDGQLIVGSYNHVLYSLDPQTGKVKWEFSEAKNRFIASPLVTEKGIFAPNADKNLYALDLEGKERWTFKAKGETWATPVTDGKCECVYLTSMDHTVYALNADTKALKWQKKDLGGAIVGTPALSRNGALYVGTFGNKMLALSTDDGRVLWEFPTEGWVWSGPALDGDRLYFGDLAGNFYALDATNGNKLWQLTPEQLDGPIAGTPLVEKNQIYFVTESGSLYAVDPGGTVQWSQPTGGKLYTQPLSTGDLVLVAPIEAENLVVAVTQDGALKWNFKPEEKN